MYSQRPYVRRGAGAHSRPEGRSAGSAVPLLHEPMFVFCPPCACSTSLDKDKAHDNELSDFKHVEEPAAEAPAAEAAVAEAGEEEPKAPTVPKPVASVAAKRERIALWSIFNHRLSYRTRAGVDAKQEGNTTLSCTHGGPKCAWL